MSDKEFGGNDDLSLPKATVQKIINEVLAANPSGIGETQTQNMAFAKEARDLLIECCVEFITMLSSEANDIAEKEAKKTIACEHITKALQDLGFGDYVPELMAVADTFKTSQSTREKKQSKIEQSGMTNEELIRAQEELFKSAGDKYNAVSPTEG
ncbi:negative cofactor 2 transcription regulator complex subunit ncb2 [Extremus antarcticus]|uniref:NCT transcriptional regulatory complex subunit B n=1 Tax=Extremus antarcticus TaxID=702011 RepID=A0AAJ0G6U4_9PEZI|nr:negative cofactor 2 transcription regulator complex subunit ncb2 [Extremus antarcticus]